MKKRQFIKSIERVADEAQQLIDAEFAKCDDHPPPGSALDQNGLRDGKDIVLDYIAHNEGGIALDHLIYMIYETGITLSQESKTLISDLAQDMQIELPF